MKWEAEGLAELELGGAQEMQENLMLLAPVDDLDAWWQHIQSSGVLERYKEARAKEPTEYVG